MLSRLCYLLKNNHNNNETADLDLQPLLSLASPVLKEIGWLASDMNASHVIRSLLCALTGIPTISERKGKGSKHQHSTSLSEPLGSFVAGSCI